MKFKHIILLAALFICGYTNAQVPSYVPTNGLVGWWPFDGNANDQSGNGNNGVVSGAVLSTDRYNNITSSFQFNGLNNYILINTVPTNSSQYSISVWAKANIINQVTNGIAVQTGIKNGTRYGSFGIRATDDGTKFIGVHRNSSELLQAINNPQTQDLNWHHYVQTWNGSQVKLYIDAVLITTVNINSTSVRNPQLTIGAMYENLVDHFFNGKIDDVGFWTTALSSAEVQQLYTTQVPCTLTSNFFATDSISACGNSVTLDAQNAGATYSWNNNATTQTINANASGWHKCTVSQGSTCNVTDSIYVSLPNALPASLQTGLVGYWPFCGNANDESGNGNNGTVNGATLTSDRFGKMNSAYSFDGIQNLISINNSNSLSIQNDISISYWFLANSSSLGYIIDRDICNTADDWSFYWQNNKVVFRSVSSFIYTDTIANNKWNNVIITRNGAYYRFYLNSIYVDSLYISNNNFTNINLPIFFGDEVCNSSGNPNFNGLLDDICIWNRALSSSEIQQLYTSQSANLTTNNTSSNNANPSNLPNGISYQAIARDSLGQPLANTNVEVRFTLRDSSVTGAVVYKETHALATNQFGLFTTAIGSGNAQSGVYANINWMGAAKFLDVELKQGSNYILLGSQQLLAVPYANAANAAGKIKNAQVPVYADNTAALAGGLQVGDMYRTPSGALMIVY